MSRLNHGLVLTPVNCILYNCLFHAQNFPHSPQYITPVMGFDGTSTRKKLMVFYILLTLFLDNVLICKEKYYDKNEMQGIMKNFESQIRFPDTG